MSKKDKLIALMVARPTTATFADVRAVLEMFGYEIANTEGSHNMFKKAGSRPISVPVVSGRKVKRRYLDRICKELELDELV